MKRKRKIKGHTLYSIYIHPYIYVIILVLILALSHPHVPPMHRTYSRSARWCINGVHLIIYPHAHPYTQRLTHAYEPISRPVRYSYPRTNRRQFLQFVSYFFCTISLFFYCSEKSILFRLILKRGKLGPHLPVARILLYARSLLIFV